MNVRLRELMRSLLPRGTDLDAVQAEAPAQLDRLAGLLRYLIGDNRPPEHRMPRAGRIAMPRRSPARWPSPVWPPRPLPGVRGHPGDSRQPPGTERRIRRGRAPLGTEQQ